MTTIVDFLQQRYNEIEAIARAAAKEYPGTWENQGGGYGIRDTAELGIVAVGAFDYMEDEVADHIALNDPKTILADVAAKRELLAAFDTASHQPGHDWGFAWSVMKATIEAHAAVFSDHPDYNESWRST